MGATVKIGELLDQQVNEKRKPNSNMHIPYCGKLIKLLWKIWGMHFGTEIEQKVQSSGKSMRQSRIEDRSRMTNRQLKWEMVATECGYHITKYQSLK